MRTDDFVRQVAQRLPLAEAALRLFDWVGRPEFLDQVFAEHRGRSYEAIISFPLLVQLTADALLEHQGSGRQSFQRAEEDGALEATLRAVYGKLGRVPLSLSMGLLRQTAARLNQVYPAAVAGSQVPASLRKLAVLFHDGKTIKHVAKRLKALKKLAGKVHGGRLVVTQSFSTGMAVAMGASEDGESAEQPLVPDVLRQVRQAVPGPRLHVGDRQFCDLIQTARFTAHGDHFLVRWNRRLDFHRDRSRPPQQGVDRYGRSYTQDWGWIGKPSDPRRRYVRRIHLRRDADHEDVILLTDLVDEAAYPADDLLEVYLHRWGIERMFQQVTEVFHLQTLIGSSPRATVFQASFCFLLYNLIQVIRAYLARPKQRPLPTISSEQLFYDVQRQLTAWSELLTTRQTVQLLASTTTAAQVARRLEQLLEGVWSERWRKTPSNTHKSPPPSRNEYPRGGHTSVYRMIQKAREGP